MTKKFRKIESSKIIKFLQSTFFKISLSNLCFLDKDENNRLHMKTIEYLEDKTENQKFDTIIIEYYNKKFYEFITQKEIKIIYDNSDFWEELDEEGVCEVFDLPFYLYRNRNENLKDNRIYNIEDLIEEIDKLKDKNDSIRTYKKLLFQILNNAQKTFDEKKAKEKYNLSLIPYSKKYREQNMSFQRKLVSKNTEKKK